MTTATTTTTTKTTTRKAARTRPPFACSLLGAAIEINGTRYDLAPFPAGESGTVAFRLVKAGSDACHDVVRTHAGLVECDCPSYEATFRDNGLGMCKHGQALVTLGLVKAPAVARAPKGVRGSDPLGAPEGVSTVETPAAPDPLPSIPDSVWDDLDRLDPIPDPFPPSPFKTLEEWEVERPTPAAPADEPGLSSPIDARDLPRIDGTGLDTGADDTGEYLRMNGASNRARGAYGRSCPDATPAEIDAVANRAATDELRRLLKDRPPAPPLPGPRLIADAVLTVMERIADATCRPPAEALPCGACAAVALTEDEEADLAEAEDAGGTSTWPDQTENWHWASEPEDTPTVVPPDPIPPDAGPACPPTLEDRLWWSRQADGKVQATRKPSRADRDWPVNVTAEDHLIAHGCV